jgi:hypothetical protein
MKFNLFSVTMAYRAGADQQQKRESGGYKSMSEGLFR